MESREVLLGRRLTATCQTLATAESCTGGLLSHRITNVSGASSYFMGGVVSYTNKAKHELLGVAQDSLDRYGAVSESVAQEMAEGARRVFDADYGVSMTGIAGPGGGSSEKPVGLVYLAVASPGGTVVHRCQFDGGRDEVKQQTADEALRMVLESIA